MYSPRVVKIFCLSAVAVALLHLSWAAEDNLVANGSFEAEAVSRGKPDFWGVAGNAAVHQVLTLAPGRNGGRCAKLECTEFNGDGPDFHAMLCQVGHVSVSRGKWYRLTLWARAERLKNGSVEVGLTNMKPWESGGLGDAFTPSREWQQFDFIFRASANVPAATSRLQLWFKSTGVLWVDDVALVEHTGGQQWFPQIATKGVTNFIPNSSFECGTANWGSFTYGLAGWGGNLYRLEGTLDSGVSHHGRSSLKIALSSQALPVYYFDYYEPVKQPVKRVFAANQGWVCVRPGEQLTLSAWLKADRTNVVGQLLVNEAPSGLQRKEVVVGKDWQRFEFSFRPQPAYLFIGAGLDLEASHVDSATLWVDAVQLERGSHATPFQPRSPVESFIETPQPGNIFTNPDAGLEFIARAFNNADTPGTLARAFRVTDFFDQVAFETNAILRLPAHGHGTLTFPRLCKDRQGYFRASWNTETEHTLRAAQIKPSPVSVTDSPFGFNHAYPWDFLVAEARAVGVVWWRDWSAKWQTVEPERGHFDFSVPDAQIQRVTALESEVEVLLPFPSAAWSTTAKPSDIDKAARNDTYLRKRLPFACAPADLHDFGKYAAETARHYLQLPNRPVTHYQVLNEPVYTDYALPRAFGYSLQDYLRLLEVASRALREVDPRCRVVGGISAGVDSAYTHDFVRQGGLKLLDVFDLHMYDPARLAEGFEASFHSLEELMRDHGGPKPVWITEWGCYADDDPASLPQNVGDATMNRCRWASERAATEHVVKFAAVAFAHGVRKIFFHAGTCGSINGPDAGGVLFEYGGTPRKMYSGVAAFSRIVGVPQACVSEETEDGLSAYVFKTATGFVAVAWSDSERPLKKLEDVHAYDVMGNEQSIEHIKVGSAPIYLSGASSQALLAVLRK